MNPLFTPEEFAVAEVEKLFPLRCSFCQGTFYKTKKYILKRHSPSNIKVTKRLMEFCSPSCVAKSILPGHLVEVNCKQCGVSFKKKLSQAVRSPNHFCSNSCSCTYHNSHKTTGTRRSRLERWLEDRLTLIYPDLEFHFNRKEAIESELDIYIPSLKLAFELNGIFHYEPIHGNDKLDKIHANDHRKMLACAERDIELCVIDASSLKYFKEKRVMPYLEGIQNIIEQAKKTE